jgi:5-hydroxyisourate hydrolase-like protein (transthyretin family)
MKRILRLLLAAVMLFSILCTVAYAGDPLDENGDTGGTEPGIGGSLADYWTGEWQGMRITVIDVTDTSDILNGTVRGKVAAGTVSVDITNLDASSEFFTRTLAGDSSTPLTYGSAVTHFGKVSKMAYRDGEALASTTAPYSFQTVSGMPALMGSSQASAQTIKDFINNQGMLTHIAAWCGVSSYEELVSGKYKLLCEPVLYSLAGTYKYAFTATEGAMYKPHGETLWTLINNTLANAFYLEHDELGWGAWTGATNINQSFQTIIDSLGMHIYSIAPETPPPSPKSVKITKKSDTGSPLSGAQFMVVGSGKNQTVTVNGTLTLDLAGWADGSYTVTETAAPSGYELNTTPQTFTISGDTVSPAELTFINSKTPPPPPPDDPPPTEVTILKVEYGTTTPLAGAEFKITRTSHWELRLVDPNGDDTGEFYDDDNGGVLNSGDDGYHHNVVDLGDDVWEWLEVHAWENVGSFLTGTNGTFPLTLDPGSFIVEEVVPPAGYVLDDVNRIQYLDIPRGGAGNDATPQTLVFSNKKLPGLTVIKVDEDTGLPLAGAEFSIRHNGNIVYEGLTDSSGIINLDSLPADWYEVTELAAPHGYLIRDEVKSVYLEAGGSAQLKFDNRRKPTLELVKLDAQSGQPLAGATFRVLKTEGNTIGEYTTGADGKVTITDLDDVIYSVEEISAPNGYLLDSQHKDVKLEWGKVTTLTFTDRKKPGLTITKTDEQTGEALADAHFRVESLDGGGFYYEGVTDANGQIHLDNLPEGVYEIAETAAPDGYITVNHPKQVQLSGGSAVNVTFTNLKKPTLTVIKLDELTNQPLAGASFKLWKTEGETWSETQVTGADGKYTWVDLDPGIYSLQEIDEPYGYIKDPARKEILLAGGDNKQLELFNRPRPALTILKRDTVTGEPIQAVKFKVQRTEGETIGEFLTGADGKIELSPATGYLLAEAVYTVTEIAPPNEYLLSDNPSKQVLLKWYEPTELIFENLLKPTLIFIKTNGLTGRGISDATYRVEYESLNGGITSLGSYNTQCGLIVIPHVLPGWYSLTETKAAPGYSLPTNPTQRLYLAPGENSYTYEQTREDLYVDDRTNPNSGTTGSCGDWCGYLCSRLCAGNCGNAGGGSMASGDGGAFGNMTITNGYGEPIGTNPNTPATPSDTTAPALSFNSVTRIGNVSATVQFTSSEAGRYYYSVANDGANVPAIATGGTGAACVAGLNTITVYMTTGEKDLYIKVKDAAGNVSDALKIDVPAYVDAAQTPAPPPTPVPSEPDISDPSAAPPSENGGIIYINPDFPGIVIIIGNP